MNYDFSKIKSEGERVKDRFKQEIGALSTGRANPAMVENLLVDSYGVGCFRYQKYRKRHFNFQLGNPAHSRQAIYPYQRAGAYRRKKKSADKNALGQIGRGQNFYEAGEG